MPGPGYDDRLKSMPPFMWVEAYERIGDLAILAYGAYNAFGLIGPEKGGVAVVTEAPEKNVIATKDIPYDQAARAREFRQIVKLLGPTALDWSPEKDIPARILVERLGRILRDRHYQTRG